MYYSLLVLGLIGIIMWLRISFKMVKAINKTT
ncbi:hypothetical protein HNQ55_001438 [Thalassotalea piscium]|uniref:Uncharacterized protein n=1 Tax=Thalassotalea piscium TaxID=1230533 RepID=A0A7X0NGB1_9GAMM|nr:hypothetical protein [Thalassotalea piscium]